MNPFRDLLQTLLIGTALAGALMPQAKASELLARPTFTPDRRFVIEGEQYATQIRLKHAPVRAFVFDRARESCHLDLRQVGKEISQLISDESDLWKTMSLLFPGPQARVRARNITVLIDDFSDYAGPNPAFGEYFINDHSGEHSRLIGLNCSELAQSYWKPALAHELTHALSDPQDGETGTLSSWEEGLAQLLETEAGGIQPALTLEHLRDASALPPVLQERRPLPDRESYAMSLLFARYLQTMLDGWRGLRILSGTEAPRTPVDCPFEFLAQLACRARTIPGTKLPQEKLTPAGLLRYFAVALTLNHPTFERYSIPDWAGLRAEAPRTELAPAQFAVFSGDTSLTGLNPALEAYRVLVGNGGRFQIVPRDQAPPDFSFSRSYILILNLTNEAKKVF